MPVEQITQTAGQLVGILAQLALVVFLALITWLIRSYVKGARAEREVTAIIQLSNAAIDYVENLDKRGDLARSPTLSKETAKLMIASEWLVKESRRAGTAITSAAAQEWIRSQFQKRVGEVMMAGTMRELARDALDLVERPMEGDLVGIPQETGRFVFLCQLAADWIVTQMGERGATTTPETALSWVRAELLKRLAVRATGEEGQVGLDWLIEQSVAFVSDLRAGDRLPSDDSNAARDLATAWILLEVAKRGLPFTPQEIVTAVRFAVPEP